MSLNSGPTVVVTDELTRMERSICGFAFSRYRRPFYRWGHLLGWLTVPLFILNFMPPIKRYMPWINLIGYLLIFIWYTVVTTRVIGKLAARLNVASTDHVKSTIVAGINQRPTIFNRSTLLAIAALLVASAFVSLLFIHGHPSLLTFARHVYEVQLVLGIFVGVALMSISIIAHFSGVTSWPRRLLPIGLGLIILSFALTFLYGFVYYGSP